MKNQQLSKELINDVYHDAADYLQRASGILEGIGTGKAHSAIGHIKQALAELSFYSKVLTPEHKRNPEAVLDAVVDTAAPAIDIALAYQDVTRDLPTDEAHDLGLTLAIGCNRRYQIDIAAAIVRGDVDGNLPVWAAFFIEVCANLGGLDLVDEIMQSRVDMSAALNIAEYIQQDVVKAYLTAGERRVLEVLNDTGKTIYLGDTAHAQSVVRPFGWTLSKDKARESARRRHAKDKPGVVYTGELERNGTWLYLEGGIGQEVAVNPDCLTITAEEWIAE